MEPRKSRKNQKNQRIANVQNKIKYNNSNEEFRI